jgi:hypothetical protein
MTERRFNPNANVSRRQRRAAASLIDRRRCASPSRRKRLEADPAEWLRYYLPASFPLPFGDVHQRMIAAAVRAIQTGTGMAVAAPRGCGKSTVLWAIALWALLSGACRFPVVAGWSHAAARRMLKKWIDVLSENKRIQADYPTATGPFEVSVHANRLRHIAWKSTGELCGADVQQMAGTVVLPDGLGALGAVSIQGSVRGLSVGLPDGSTARPDLLLLDDPQDKATAESPKLARQIVERIESDLFNIAGPDVRLTVMCAVTIIADGDVAAHFLEHADFEGIRVPQITRWPDGWDDKDSAVRAQWDRWNQIRVAGIAGHDGGDGSRGFYLAHKNELTAGMTVSWEHRFDRKRNDPDALYAAMLDFYRLGERSFMAERQNAPIASGINAITELPHDMVAGKVSGLVKRVAPETAVALVGMCDLNADGARWALASVTNTAALCIVEYGIHPGGGRPLVVPGESESIGLMRGLSGLDETLRSLTVTKNGAPLRIDMMLVDVGWMMQATFDWLSGPGRLSTVPWLGARGWSSRSYRPGGKTTIGRPGDNHHLAEWPGKGRALVFNSDVWRHRQQKAWPLPVGAPDSIALYGTTGTRHDVFADGVCCEKLTAYVETPAGPLYRWAMTPGLRNDWGDVCTGLLVAANRMGFTATGIRPAAAPARKRYTQEDFDRSRR